MTLSWFLLHFTGKPIAWPLPELLWNSAYANSLLMLLSYYLASGFNII